MRSLALMRCLLSLALLVRAAPATASPAVCQGTHQAEFTRSSSVLIVDAMRSQLEGCQVVIGDLHIMNIHQQEFLSRGRPFSLAFLDTIQEVTGCVRIINSCFRATVIFRGLRVIRGANCDSAVTIQYLSDCRFPQPDAIFSRLAYIANGGVTVAGLKACHLARSVNYTELFHDPSKQRLSMPSCSGAHSCHPDCPLWPDGSRHCWGPGRDHCQERTRCWNLSAEQCPSGRCHLDAVSERCCAEQCAGGCHGTAASQCLACANFNKSGVCVGACSPAAVYDPSSAAYIRLNEPKHYPLGPVCVTRCPRTYHTQEDGCVSRCSEGFAPANDGVCVRRETGRACEQSGQSAAICSPDNPLLAAGSNSSLLCTHYTGDLSILDSCLHPDEAAASHGNRPLTLDELYFYLSRLTEIRGSLSVILTRQENLTFLSALRRIDKRPGRAGDGSIAVHSRGLRFLGLESLSYLGGSLSLVPPTVLCPGLLPKRLAFENGLVTLGANSTGGHHLDNVRNSTSASDCPRCDPECDPAYGCWGPGPDFCVRCHHYRLPDDRAGGRRGICVANCDSVGGWFDAGRVENLSTIVNESLCSRCHQLCRRCAGTGRLDCTECATNAFRDAEDARCVPACSMVRQFADADQICRPCPEACLPAIESGSQEPTCTGNLSIVGPGGCSFCSKVLELEPDAESRTAAVTRCLRPLAACPAGHQLRVLESDGAELHFAWRRRRPHNPVSVCRRFDGLSSVNGGDEGGEVDSAADATADLKRRRLAREARLAAAYVGAGVIVVVALLVTGAACHWLRQRANGAAAAATAIAEKGLGSRRRMMIDSSWDEDAEPLNAPDGCEGVGGEISGVNDDPGIAVLRTISEKELTRGAEIGSGAFGTVYRGEWLPEAGDGQPRRRLSVAIKILADSSDCGGSCLSGELLAEGRIMASVRHRHCLSLVGVCMTQPAQLISRFLPLGNLRDFLRARRGTGQLGSSHLLRFAAQIASGMAYLEQRSVIHRDLACRNVLVASSRCVKITDFGLARLMESPNEEYRASGGKLPVKWLALECLVSRRFSHKSDVWAYGVTLWEIFMFGEPPYASVKPVDLADYLEKGERLPQPPICTLDVYILMIKCWMLNEAQRPSFEQLESNFRKMCSAPGRYVYIKGDKFNANSSAQRGAGGSDGGGGGGGGDSSDVTPTGSGSGSLQDAPPTTAAGVGGVGDGGGEYSPLEATEGNEEDVDDVFRSTPPPLAPADPDSADTAASYCNVKDGGGSGGGGGSFELKLMDPHGDTGKQDNKYTQDPCSGQELQPLLQQHDGYLMPITAKRPSNLATVGPVASVHNPEYFFNTSRIQLLPPPSPPPPPPPLLVRETE